MRVKLNESGMSLVQVVIAAGMMSMLGLFMMKMQENQTKTQNDIAAKAEIVSFMQKLNSLMATAGYCEKNLNGKKVTGEPISLSEFQTPNDKVLFKVGDVYGDRQLILKGMEQKDFFFDDEQKTRGLLSFNVALEKKKKSFGARVIKKTLEVVVHVDEQGRIQGCGSTGLNTSGIGGVSTGSVQSVLEKASAKVELKNLDEKKIKKLIDNNPALKQMQEAINNMNKANKEMEGTYKD